MATADELYDQGLTFYGEGKHEDADRVLKEAVALDPEHAEALRALGMNYFHMERFDEAIEVGKKLVEQLPEDILARTSLSMYYQKKGMIEEAEAEGAQARILGWKEQLKNNPGGTPITPPPGVESK